MNNSLKNTGTRRPSGVIRTLTITEQLQQCTLSPIGGEILHPVHGKLEVTQKKANELLEIWTEGQLHRIKAKLYK